MDIAIDCRWITSDSGGIRYYTLNLIKHLALVDRANKYILIYDTESTRDEITAYTGNPANFRCVRFEYPLFSLKTQYELPFLLNKSKVDIFHSTYFIIPFFGLNCKKVISLHDLIPYLYPELCAKSKKTKFHFFFKLITAFSVKSADAIVACSENTKKDILKTFNVPESKVDVVYLGADERFNKGASVSDIRRIREKFGITGKAVLYAGRQDPSKNLLNLIKSFELARKTAPCQLIISGKKDSRYAGPYELAEKSSYRKDIIFTGFVPGDELPLLFKACDIFAFPTLYEGFGLPPLEAMACGVPVVTSNVSSLPEVVGDAALTVNPRDVDEIAAAISRLLTDGSLRAEMSRRGLERAKKFSWNSTAAEMIKVYKKVCPEK